MAEKNYVVSLSIDDKGAVAAVNDMTTALNKADTSSQSLKTQLRQMQQELQKLDVGSVEFQKLSQEAGKLKDQINDAAEAVRANAGGSFESLSNNASLLKDRLFNLDLEGVGQSFKSIAGTVKGFSFKEMQAGLGSLTSGISAMGKALLTNPIFLIAGAIAAAVAYSDELLSLFDGISAADEEQLNAQKEKANLAKEQLDTISASEEILKEQGLTEKEITQRKQEQLEKAILTQKSIVETLKGQLTLQIEAAKRNKEILTGILQFIASPLTLLLGTVDAIILGLNKVGAISDETYANIGNLREKVFGGISGLLFDPEQIQKDGEAAIKESENELLRLENQAAGYRNREREKRRQAAETKKKETVEAEQSVSDVMATLTADDAEEIEKLKAEHQERLRVQQEKANAVLLELQRKHFEEEKGARELAKADELAAAEQKYLEQKQALELAQQSTTELTEYYNQQIKSINDKYDAEAKAAQAIKDAEELARVEKNKQFAIDATQQGLSTIQSLTELFGKKGKESAKRAFAINKAASIAQATISTYQSATSAYASQFLPVPDISSPVRGAIAAGLAIAAGVANIAKISSQKFDGGGGGSGGGGGGSVPSVGGGGGGNQPTVPAFNALNLGFLQNRPEQTPKAYVLAQDVSTAVEARDKVRDLARIN